MLRFSSMNILVFIIGVCYAMCKAFINVKYTSKVIVEFFIITCILLRLE